MRKKHYKSIVLAAALTISMLIVSGCYAGNANSSPGSQTLQPAERDRLNQYTTLLSAEYTQDAKTLSTFSDNDREFAERQVDPLRKGYIDYGMPIKKAQITYKVESVKRTANTTFVRSLFTTTIDYLDSPSASPNDIQQSLSDDLHEIQIPRFATKNDNIDILDDNLLPESDDSSSENPTDNNLDKDSPLSTDINKAGSALSQELNRMAGADWNFPVVQASKYAKNWTTGQHYGDTKDKFNPKYPYYKNNCANFISQILYDNEGGQVKRNVSLWDYKNDNAWGYYGFGKATYTWGGAANNYRYMRYYSGLYNPQRPALTAYDLPQGSLLYGDWDSDASINHVAYINRAVRTGFNPNGAMIFMPHITQKSTCRYDVPLSEYFIIAKKEHKKITWYGLSTGYHCTYQCK